MIETITIEGENGDSIELEVLATTKLNGSSYILATDALDDEDGEAYILKDNAEETDLEADYEFVMDDDELELIGKIFNELVDEDTTVE